MYKDIEVKVKSLLNKYKVKYRYLHLEDNKLYIGVEGDKYKYPILVTKLKLLKLRPISLIYGRWVFVVNSL